MFRILVVDDDEGVRHYLRELLERSGYEVVEAVNGAKALSLYKANPTDLVITNILMPEKEGLETIRELRRGFPGVKIIAISGGGQIGPSDYLAVAQRLGAARTFSKPFDQKKLLGAVEELLNAGK